ncbi:sensor histidine kinase [Paracoccus litorisediminis]|uniref:histidine kinase n=1 Tax=Paracoccus litorisediminis TaxID=2006130 RepID=A0A844HPL0_9RHOB|nr:ATP-binding protein [Paracoccus litorisediminis]MTH62323.1 hypothetical protein [Paracoccus litorisediminis]
MTRTYGPVLAGGFWLTAALVAAALVATVEYRRGSTELTRLESQAETRLAEKLAQHDAHLTALAAVVRMEPADPSESVQGLATAVTAFYPRIIGITTIRGDGKQPVTYQYGQTPGPAFDPSDELPVLETPGSTAFRSDPAGARYAIYKLVAPGVMIRMDIDADGLVADDTFPTGYSYRLWLADALLIEQPANGPALVTATRSTAVTSPSQPMRIEVARGFSVAELLPARVILPVLLLLGIATWLGLVFVRSVQARRREELRATLFEQEARLAHAGRVNALGEMASGIAHELAQPVAALLTQSQAARRALTIKRPDILERALDANVREARRAGDILDRMRAYIAGETPRLEPVPLDRALSDALRLAEADLARRGIEVSEDIAGECAVRIDVIAFQQVIHNILLNAADALTGRSSPRISIRAICDDHRAIITVADNGPGISSDVLPRVFEPFFTTKRNGMGLGLPLCARLIEKMDGSLEAGNAGGAVFTIRLPCEGLR